MPSWWRFYLLFTKILAKCSQNSHAVMHGVYGRHLPGSNIYTVLNASSLLLQRIWHMKCNVRHNSSALDENYRKNRRHCRIYNIDTREISMQMFSRFCRFCWWQCRTVDNLLGARKNPYEKRMYPFNQQHSSNTSCMQRGKFSFCINRSRSCSS